MYNTPCPILVVTGFFSEGSPAYTTFSLLGVKLVTVVTTPVVVVAKLTEFCLG